MAVVIHHIPDRTTYMQTILWALGRAEDDAEFRQNLRILMAVLLAKGYDDANPPTGKLAAIFDIMTSESFYLKGYNKTSNQIMWFPSYVGFEKLSSKWAKETYPGCRGYLCMRLIEKDIEFNEVEAHTVQIYF